MTEVQAGSLGGLNPSEEEQDDDGPVGVTGKPSATEENGKPEPEPAAEPEDDEPKKKGSAARLYVVLKEESFDDGEPYTVKVHEVESRNATNALRKAAKELHGQFEGTATLLVIPKTMWRPTAVSLTVSERVSVSIG